jgi:hypothetical protein
MRHTKHSETVDQYRETCAGVPVVSGLGTKYSPFPHWSAKVSQAQQKSLAGNVSEPLCIYCNAVLPGLLKQTQAAPSHLVIETTITSGVNIQADLLAH